MQWVRGSNPLGEAQSPSSAASQFFQFSQSESIIDMEQSNLKPNQRFYPGEPGTYHPLCLEALGELAKARGWEPMTDPRWNPLQIGAYYRGYNREIRYELQLPYPL